MAVSEVQISQLLQAATKAREAAYASYSGFAVGAAIIVGGGAIFTGCNVENASYGLTVCAERVAISKAVSEGERDIVAVGIVAPGESPAVPCGACLQVMSEFGGPEMIVVCATPDGEHQEYRLGELLPKPFEL